MIAHGFVAAANKGYVAYLAPEGVETSDGRMFQPGSLSWREQVALTWSPSEEGHGDAVLVGNVLNLRFQTVEGVTWAVGDVDWDSKTAEGKEAKRLVDEGRQNGLSVHLGEFDADMVCRSEMSAWADGGETAGDCDWDEALLVVTVGEIAAATLVLIPAFAEARVILAGVTPLKDFPVGDRGAAWDQAAADARWRTFTGSDDGPSDTYRDGFLWFDAEDADNFGAYKLQVVDVVDDAATYMPRAVFAAAGGRGVNAADIPAGDKTRVKASICRLYERINDGAGDDDSEVECPFASLAAALNLALPDRDAFEVVMDGPTRLTVTDEGLIYGHLALWDTCHRGFPDVCVTPPRGGGYDGFHDNAQVMLSDGTSLAVGVITMDVLHAPSRTSAGAARQHYEDSGTCAAYVRAGEDAWGVWVSGVIDPALGDIAKLRLGRMSLSGDWRTIDGQLTLIAAQAVPVPGFPIRLQVAAGATVELTTVGLGPDELAATVDYGIERLADQVARLTVLLERQEAQRKADQIITRLDDDLGSAHWMPPGPITVHMDDLSVPLSKITFVGNTDTQTTIGYDGGPLPT